MTTAGMNKFCAGSPSVSRWWSPFVGSGNITVVQVDLRADAAREELALGWLDHAERSRCNKYAPEPRRHFTLCRAALRSIICLEVECGNDDLSFGEGAYGKPFTRIAGCETTLEFSVSHSGEFGLIAYAPSGRLGVDVEQITPKRHLNSLIEAVMGPDERQELEEMPEQVRLHQFFRLWTCKEALVKALGTGLSTDVSSFQVPENIRRGEAVADFRFPHHPELGWRLQDISGAGFAAALASELRPASPCPTDASAVDLEVDAPGCEAW